jgi:hypothetical protein
MGALLLQPQQLHSESAARPATQHQLTGSRLQSQRTARAPHMQIGSATKHAKLLMTQQIVHKLLISQHGAHVQEFVSY